MMFDSNMTVMFYKLCEIKQKSQDFVIQKDNKTGNAEFNRSNF